MSELRRLLGVLDDEGEGAGVAPQPGLDQLGALLDRVREAGLAGRARGGRHAAAAAAEPRCHGLPDRPGGADQRAPVCARAATLVRLTWEPAQLRIEILDDGPAAGAGARRRFRARAGRHARACRAGRGSTGSRAAARRRVRGPGVAAAGDGGVVTHADERPVRRAPRRPRTGSSSPTTRRSSGLASG